MTKDKKALAKLAANAETVGLDPVLKRQIEMELHAGYAFNAKTAKYGVVTVWITSALMIASAVLAVASAMACVFLVASGQSIQLLKSHPTKELYEINLSPDMWVALLGSTIVLSIAFLFFRYMSLAMRNAQHAAEAMADQYKSDTA